MRALGAQTTIFVVSESSWRSSYYIRNACGLLEPKLLFLYNLRALGVQTIIFIVPGSSWRSNYNTFVMLDSFRRQTTDSILRFSTFERSPLLKALYSSSGSEGPPQTLVFVVSNGSLPPKTLYSSSGIDRPPC